MRPSQLYPGRWVRCDSSDSSAAATQSECTILTSSTGLNLAAQRDFMDALIYSGSHSGPRLAKGSFKPILCLITENASPELDGRRLLTHSAKLSLSVSRENKPSLPWGG